MAKKEVAPVIAELQKLLKEEKLIFGADRALKLLRDGKITKVFLASNVKKTIRLSYNIMKPLYLNESVYLSRFPS